VTYLSGDYLVMLLVKFPLTVRNSRDFYLSICLSTGSYVPILGCEFDLVYTETYEQRNRPFYSSATV